MSKIDRYKKKQKKMNSNRKAPKSNLPLFGEKYKVGGLDGVCVKRTSDTATILCLDGEHVITNNF